MILAFVDSGDVRIELLKGWHANDAFRCWHIRIRFMNEEKDMSRSVQKALLGLRWIVFENDVVECCDIAFSCIFSKRSRGDVEAVFFVPCKDGSVGINATCRDDLYEVAFFDESQNDLNGSWTSFDVSRDIGGTRHNNVTDPLKLVSLDVLLDDCQLSEMGERDVLSKESKDQALKRREGIKDGSVAINANTEPVSRLYGQRGCHGEPPWVRVEGAN